MKNNEKIKEVTARLASAKELDDVSHEKQNEEQHRILSLVKNVFTRLALAGDTSWPIVGRR